MRRTFDYHPNNQYGWNTTSSDYVEHVTRMARMPSVFSDAPPYPSVRRALNEEVIIKKEKEDHVQQANHHKHQAPAAPKKVHFAEKEKITEVDKKGNGTVKEEKDINMEADGFIQRKHKTFELYRWPTLKAS